MTNDTANLPISPGTYLLYPHDSDIPSLWILRADGRWWHPQCDVDNTASADEMREAYQRAVPHEQSGVAA